MLLGTAADRLVLAIGLPVAAVSLVAMAATFAAATRAPFASMVFLFELTRDFHVVLPLMLAMVVAVPRRGLRVRSEFHTTRCARPPCAR